jgi:hypothetical protein
MDRNTEIRKEVISTPRPWHYPLPACIRFGLTFSAKSALATLDTPERFLDKFQDAIEHPAPIP